MGRLWYKRGCRRCHPRSPLCMLGSWPYYLLHLLLLIAMTGHKKLSLESCQIGFSTFFVLFLRLKYIFATRLSDQGIIFLLKLFLFSCLGCTLSCILQHKFLSTNIQKLWQAMSGVASLSFHQIARGFDGQWDLRFSLPAEV